MILFKWQGASSSNHIILKKIIKPYASYSIMYNKIKIWAGVMNKIQNNVSKSNSVDSSTKLVKFF